MERFGKFEIIEEIARGGMGIVYKAVDPERAGVVALKVLIAGDEAPEKSIQRFYQEAEAISRLQHPNIVKVLEIGEADGRHYYTMNFVDGMTLDSVIKKGGLKESDTSHLIKEVASALAYCHGMNIIHRDIKPSNIIVDRKTWLPKILDFGVAKDLVLMTQLTAEEEVLGTPQYMSPEQAAGDNAELDYRTDIYSLGVVLYEMLTGRPPITADNHSQMIVKVIQGEKELPSFYNPQVNKQLEAICLKAMARRKEERYKNANDMATDLANYQNPKKCLAKPVTIIDKSLLNVKKHAALILTALFTFFVLIGIATTAITRWQLFSKKREYQIEQLNISVKRYLKEAEGNEENLGKFVQQVRLARRCLQIIDVLDPTINTSGHKQYKSLLQAKTDQLVQRGKALVRNKNIPEAYIVAQYLYHLGFPQKFKTFEEVKTLLDLKGDQNSLQIMSNFPLRYKLYTLRNETNITGTLSAQTDVPLENLEPGNYLFVLERDAYFPIFHKIRIEKESLSFQVQLIEESELPEGSILLYKSNEQKISPALCLDRFCVTNQDYYNYLRVNDRPIPAKFTPNFLQQFGSKSVTGVSFQEATAYAEWLGKRLPSQQEWEWIQNSYNETLYPSVLREVKNATLFQQFLVPKESEFLSDGSVVLQNDQKLSFLQPDQNQKIRLVWSYEETEKIRNISEKRRADLKKFLQLLDDIDYKFQQALNDIHRAYLNRSYERASQSIAQIENYFIEQKQNKNVATLCATKLNGLKLLSALEPSFWNALKKIKNEKIQVDEESVTLLSVDDAGKTFEAKTVRQTKTYRLEDLWIKNLSAILQKDKDSDLSLAILLLYSGKRDKGTEIILKKSETVQEQFRAIFPFYEDEYWPSLHAAKEKGFVFDRGNSWLSPKEANQIGFYFFEGEWVDAKRAHQEGRLLLLDNQIYTRIQAQSKGYIYKDNNWRIEEQYWQNPPFPKEIQISEDPKTYFTSLTLLNQDTAILGTIRGNLLVLSLTENKAIQELETPLKKGIYSLKNYGDLGTVATGNPGQFYVYDAQWGISRQFTGKAAKFFEKEKITDHLFFPEQNSALVLTGEDKLYDLTLDGSKMDELKIPNEATPILLTLDGKKMLGAFAKGDKLYFYRDHEKFSEKTRPITLENAKKQRIAFSPDLYRAATFTFGATGTFINVITLSLQPEILQIDVGEILESITFSPSGNLLAVSTQIGTVRIYNLKNIQSGKLEGDQFLREFKVRLENSKEQSDIHMEFLGFTPAGDTLITAGKVGGERKVIRWEN